MWVGLGAIDVQVEKVQTSKPVPNRLRKIKIK